MCTLLLPLSSRSAGAQCRGPPSVRLLGNATLTDHERACHRVGGQLNFLTRQRCTPAAVRRVAPCAGFGSSTQEQNHAAYSRDLYGGLPK